MEELNLIIQDFEETCSTLAITHDNPCEETIREKFEEYHQAKLKLLGIGGVSQQRELLEAFREHFNKKNHYKHHIYEADMEDFIESL